jgi:hypothetical protein
METTFRSAPALKALIALQYFTVPYVLYSTVHRLNEFTVRRDYVCPGVAAAAISCRHSLFILRYRNV